MVLARVATRSVLARPGTPCNSRWPPVNTADQHAASTTTSWPTTTCPIRPRTSSEEFRGGVEVGGVTLDSSCAHGRFLEVTLLLEQELVDGSVEFLAAQALEADDPFVVEDEGRGEAEHLPALLDSPPLAAAVIPRRPIQPVAAPRAEDDGLVLVAVDAQVGERLALHFLDQRLCRLVFHSAVAAPVGPEVQHDHLASEGTELERFAGEVLSLDLLGRRADVQIPQVLQSFPGDLAQGAAPQPDPVEARDHFLIVILRLPGQVQRQRQVGGPALLCLQAPGKGQRQRCQAAHLLLAVLFVDLGQQAVAVGVGGGGQLPAHLGQIGPGEVVAANRVHGAQPELPGGVGKGFADPRRPVWYSTQARASMAAGLPAVLLGQRRKAARRITR